MEYSAGNGTYPDAPQNRYVNRGARYAKRRDTWSADRMRGFLRMPKALHGEGDLSKEIRSYLEKAPEGVRFDRFRKARIYTTIAGIGWGVLTIYTQQPIRVIMTAAFLNLALLVWLDAFGLFKTLLAEPTRIILALQIAAWVIFANTRVANFGWCCLVLTAATAVLMAALNRTWLARETYNRTVGVKMALQELLPEDVEAAWCKLEGEVNALAYEAGAPVRDPADQIVRKLCTIRGLEAGMAGLREAVAERDFAKQCYAELGEKYDKALADLKSVYQYMQEKDTLVPDLEVQVEKYKGMYDYWSGRASRAEESYATIKERERDYEAQIIDLKLEIQNLKMELSALADSSVVEEGEAITPTRIDQETMIVNFLCTKNPDTGDWNGIRRTAKEFGVTDYMVRKIVKDRKEEIDAERRRLVEEAI